MNPHRAVDLALAVCEAFCVVIFVLAVLLYAALVVRADEVLHRLPDNKWRLCR
jgi:hypothetical protein